MKVCGQLVKPSRLATGQILLVFLTFCVALQRPFRPHHGVLTKTMMCLKCDVAVDLQKQKEMNAIMQKRRKKKMAPILREKKLKSIILAAKEAKLKKDTNLPDIGLGNSIARGAAAMAKDLALIKCTKLPLLARQLCLTKTQEEMGPKKPSAGIVNLNRPKLDSGRPTATIKVQVPKTFSLPKVKEGILTFEDPKVTRKKKEMELKSLKGKKGAKGGININVGGNLPDPSIPKNIDIPNLGKVPSGKTAINTLPGSLNSKAVRGQAPKSATSLTNTLAGAMGSAASKKSMTGKMTYPAQSGVLNKWANSVADKAVFGASAKSGRESDSKSKTPNQDLVKAVEQSLEVKAAKGLLRKRLPKPGSDGPVVAPPLVKVPKKKNVEAEEKQLKLAKQKKVKQLNAPPIMKGENPYKDLQPPEVSASGPSGPPGASGPPENTYAKGSPKSPISVGKPPSPKAREAPKKAAASRHAEKNPAKEIEQKKEVAKDDCTPGMSLPRSDYDPSQVEVEPSVPKCSKPCTKTDPESVKLCALKKAKKRKEMSLQQAEQAAEAGDISATKDAMLNAEKSKFDKNVFSKSQPVQKSAALDGDLEEAPLVMPKPKESKVGKVIDGTPWDKGGKPKFVKGPSVWSAQGLNFLEIKEDPLPDTEEVNRLLNPKKLLGTKLDPNLPDNLGKKDARISNDSPGTPNSEAESSPEVKHMASMTICINEGSMSLIKELFKQVTGPDVKISCQPARSNRMWRDPADP